METLRHFLIDICGVTPDWKMEDVLEEEIKAIRKTVASAEHVICALSGGVDSTVAATLVHRAIGDRLHCVFVDNGLLRMEGEGVQPNARTMVTALSACGRTGHLQLGRRIHTRVPAHCLILNNAVLHMYMKCGSLEEAKALFGSMTERDSISWTTMLSGFAKSGEFDAARGMFNAMPSHDTASWNALISGYHQNGRPKEALDLFHRMQRAHAKPDRVTLVAALSACAELGALHLGCWIHTFIENKGLDLNFHLTTSLVDMYCKCGDLDKALKVFGSVHQRDVFVWSAMIGGLAMHGRGKDALELFLQMLRAQVKPNGVTFTNVLCACSHSGLVEEGRLYFAQMLPVYGIKPEPEHYACMVDILGRARLVEEARELLLNMPMQPHLFIGQ